MKVSKFSKSQILSILKQVEAGQAVPDICREHGIRSATILQMACEIWWDGCLAVGSWRKKRLIREKPDALAVPDDNNQCWSMDFMHDQLQNGRSY